MASLPSTPAKKTSKKLKPRGRKMSKEEARAYVFRTHREAMALLAKH